MAGSSKSADDDHRPGSGNDGDTRTLEGNETEEGGRDTHESRHSEKRGSNETDDDVRIIAVDLQEMAPIDGVMQLQVCPCDCLC